MWGTTRRTRRRLSLALSCSLVLKGLLAACDAQIVHIEADEDGSQAYLKLAEAWCGHIERCAKAANDGRTWASHEACVQDLRRNMSPNERDLACDGSSDVRIQAKSLARCLRAFSDASCQRLSNLMGEGLGQLSEHALLAGCRDAVDEVYAAEARLFALPAVGSACDENSGCFCERSSDAACGVCKALPKAGEPCVRDQDGSICGGDLTCSPAGLCQPEASAEGEPCPEGRCQRGLECADGRCQQLHREGDPCSDVSGCGPWFVCEAKSCRYRPGQALGEPCSFDSPLDSERCWAGMCVNGVCRERPDLGEPCAQECPSCDPYCLSPFQCVEGICREIPDCSAGPGEPCFGNPTCRDGYYCSDSDFRCRPTKAELGQGCVPEGGCELGACDDGHCVLRSPGAACSDDKECSTRRCDAGHCATSPC